MGFEIPAERSASSAGFFALPASCPSAGLESPALAAACSLTAVWATSFAASAVVSALIIHADSNSSAPLIITQVAGFVIPAVFTKRYTERKRAAAGTTPQG